MLGIKLPAKPRKAPLKPTGESPYLDARLIDMGLLEREQRHATSWRRAFFATLGLCFVTLVIALFLATKDHTEAVVYKEDANGDMALIGLSSHARIPSEPAVRHQLVVWLEAVRDIPGADDDLINRNAQTALYMTTADSPAYNAYRTFIYADNPKVLSAHGYRRTVVDVDVSRLADLTYRLTWHERLRQGGSNPDGLPQGNTYTGTVYLAAPPEAPSDPLVGQFNPAGVYIKDFDMNWSVLKS